MLVRHGDVVFDEPDCYLADSTLFDVFSFSLIAGNERTALSKPYSVVLTRSAVKRYFGDGDVRDALEKTLEMDGEQYKVTGVMDNVPENSHFQFDILASFSTWSATNKDAESSQWFWNSFRTYLLLHNEHQVDGLRAKMKGFIERNIKKRRHVL